MCQGGFLQKDENQRWNLFKDLAEKIIQWEPILEKFRNTNLISSKGGIHSIESSITVEARIATLSRGLELLETKKPIPMNQVSLTQSQIRAVLIVKP